jgi:hypothetical protein
VSQLELQSKGETPHSPYTFPMPRVGKAD